MGQITIRWSSKNRHDDGRCTIKNIEKEEGNLRSSQPPRLWCGAEEVVEGGGPPSKPPCGRPQSEPAQRKQHAAGCSPRHHQQLWAARRGAIQDTLLTQYVREIPIVNHYKFFLYGDYTKMLMEYLIYMTVVLISNRSVTYGINRSYRKNT
jgi:hypothetical protein